MRVLKLSIICFMASLFSITILSCSAKPSENIIETIDKRVSSTNESMERLICEDGEFYKDYYDGNVLVYRSFTYDIDHESYALYDFYYDERGLLIYCDITHYRGPAYSIYFSDDDLYHVEVGPFIKDGVFINGDLVNVENAIKEDSYYTFVLTDLALCLEHSYKENIAFNKNPFFFPDKKSKEYDAKFTFLDTSLPDNINLTIVEVLCFESGVLYELRIDCDNDFSGRDNNGWDRFQIGYFYVQEKMIYLLRGQDIIESIKSEEDIIKLGTIVCQNEEMEDTLHADELGWHEYILVNDNQCEYHSYNNLTETGFYESFTWEYGKGLVEYRSGFGAEREGIELQLIDSKIIAGNVMTNYYEGNCLCSDGERYYYRSLSDMYYLYSSDINGNDRIKLAEEVPGVIYIKDEWVYFENLSDDSKLYRVRKNGSDLQKISDIIMKNFILCDGYFYYISEEDLLCRLEIEQWSQKIIYDEEIHSFMTDGNNLALRVERLVDNDVFRDIIICSMDGKEKMRFNNLNELNRYYLDADYLYYYDGDGSIQKFLLKCKNRNPEPELISNITDQWILYGDCIYIYDGGRVSIIRLSDKKKQLLFEIPFEIWDLYILNNEIFVQYIDEQMPEYGLMWYHYDRQLNQFILLEALPDIPDILRDRGTGGEAFPYGTEADIAEKYLDTEITYIYEKEVLADWYVDGVSDPDYIHIKFPQFNSNVMSADIINEQIKKVLDKEKKIGEEFVYSSDKRDIQPFKRYEAYASAYVNDEYVCVPYRCIKSEDKFEYNDRYTLLYSAETGEELDIRDILSKNDKKYRDILTFVISKHIEKEFVEQKYLFQFIGNWALREGEIEKGLNEESFFLSEDGLVVIYKNTFSFRAPTTFEIPYEYLESVGIW